MKDLELKKQEELLLENFKIEELEQRLEMKHDWGGASYSISINDHEVYSTEP